MLNGFSSAFCLGAHSITALSDLISCSVYLTVFRSLCLTSFSACVSKVEQPRECGWPRRKLRQRAHSYTKWAGCSDAVTKMCSLTSRTRKREKEDGKQGQRDKQERKVKTCQDVWLKKGRGGPEESRSRMPEQKQQKCEQLAGLDRRIADLPGKKS